MKKAFTLIELLIVVAIIAILAAIAIPNFLEAQTRAKVARSKSDMRTLAVGLEAYIVDWDKSAPDGNDYVPQGSGRNHPMAEMNRDTDLLPFQPKTADANSARLYYFRTYRTWTYLTTPVAYMNSILIEPYSSWIPYSRMDNGTGVTDPPFMILNSVGPDRTILASRLTSVATSDETNMSVSPPGFTGSGALSALNNIYDPTNGTLSWGDVYRFAALKSGSSAPYGSLLPMTFPN